MRRGSGCRLLLAAALLVAGCQPGPPALAPVAVAPGVPDLRGLWTGTWGGAPARLVITGQADLQQHAGVYLGPVQLLGQRLPGLTGVLTLTVRGEARSANVQGWFGATGAGPALVLVAVTPDGREYATLRPLSADRLAGTGDADFAWGPRGVVDLARAAAPSSSR